MKIFFILTVVSVTAFAAPEGYNYKESSSVIQKGNLNGYQSISGNKLPCSHASHQALIQEQSTGRILNQHHNSDNNLVTALSGINPQSQAVTVNSQIVVGESGSASSGISGGSHEYQNGQGQIAIQSSAKVPFQQQLPQLQFQQFPSHSPAQSFNFGNIAPGRVVPSQVLSGQTQGYSYNQGGSAFQIRQDYQSLRPGPGAIINGVGKVPLPLQHILNRPTQSFQYASGYGGNKFLSSQTGHIATYNDPTDFSAQVAYRPKGINPKDPVNFADNLPIPNGSAQYAGSFQHGSNPYYNCFSHNSISDSSDGGSFGASSIGLLAGTSKSPLCLTQNEHSSSGSDIELFNSVLTAGSAVDGQLGNVIRETFANAPLDPKIEKHIYVHVPPEDLDDNVAKQSPFLSQQSAKKHYKIIFIKAPSAPHPNYAQLASAAAQHIEEKTLVYVLVKKHDEPSFDEIKEIQQTVHKSSKPEVYFIKYKTRKENEGRHLPTIATKSESSGGGSEQYNAGSTSPGLGGYNVVPGGIQSNEGIDNRGGDTSFESSLNSYSASLNSLSPSSFNVGVSGEQKHELYGVPLE